jgi:hypothetical protein
VRKGGGGEGKGYGRGVKGNGKIEENKKFSEGLIAYFQLTGNVPHRKRKKLRYT